MDCGRDNACGFCMSTHDHNNMVSIYHREDPTIDHGDADNYVSYCGDDQDDCEAWVRKNYSGRWMWWAGDGCMQPRLVNDDDRSNDADWYDRSPNGQWGHGRRKS